MVCDVKVSVCPGSLISLLQVLVISIVPFTHQPVPENFTCPVKQVEVANKLGSLEALVVELAGLVPTLLHPLIANAATTA